MRVPAVTFEKEIFLNNFDIEKSQFEKIKLLHLSIMIAALHEPNSTKTNILQIRDAIRKDATAALGRGVDSELNEHSLIFKSLA